MPQALGVFVVLLGILATGSQRAGAPRSFNTVVNLETTSEESANVSDLDGDGDLDLLLAKGRHTPLLDRVLLNDGRGGFVASDLGPTADRTYTAALADVDGDDDLDVLTSNDRPDQKLVSVGYAERHSTERGRDESPSKTHPSAFPDEPDRSHHEKAEAELQEETGNDVAALMGHECTPGGKQK